MRGHVLAGTGAITTPAWARGRSAACLAHWDSTSACSLLTSTSARTDAYGAAALLVALQVCVYYSAQIVLFGTEIKHVQGGGSASIAPLRASGCKAGQNVRARSRSS